ncbi:InlB B-repeat-containing protein [Butyrivibrio sp. INlla16]|uniref:InlB B-repeat-containing protein n=1 Tax=Butyrivibrio sp. INlla16 TaxID=1520807 RepID=UPI00147AA482|nr:InlB B-repeat-containing protein [Butyrivibrio sp. INlla16]
MRTRRAEIIRDARIFGANGILEKELAVHDILLEINTYDNECYTSRNPNHLGHTAYGALINGTSVCDGYSMAFSYLLEGINVNSITVGGYAGSGSERGGHAWNMVQVGGDWYETDTTWDDQEGNSSWTDAFRKAVTHEYYHLTTADIQNHNSTISAGSTGRYRDAMFYRAPSATSTTYSYENVLAAIDGNLDYEVEALQGISLSPSSIAGNAGTVGTGGTFTVTCSPAGANPNGLVWSSSNTNVVTVNQIGQYQIVGPGVADITAETLDGKVKAVCQAIITDEFGDTWVGGITVNPETVSADIGVQGTIEYTITPESASNKRIRIKNSNENVVYARAGILSNRIIYETQNYGVSLITVTTEDGMYTGYCVINVPAPTCWVSFDLNGLQGVDLAPKKVEYGQQYGELPELTCPGYRFDGWFTRPTGGTQVTPYTRVSTTQNHTLYAHWTEIVEQQDPDDNNQGGNGNNGNNGNTDQGSGGGNNDTSSDETITSGDNDYQTTSSDTATVTKEDNKNITSVTISDTVTYNGKTYKITEIQSNAYKGCTKLKKLTIGSNVTKIGAGAFSGCKNLKNITVRGNNLKTVGSGSFKGISPKAKITIICKNKKIFNKLVKKFKKAGAKKATFKFKKG